MRPGTSALTLSGVALLVLLVGRSVEASEPSWKAEALSDEKRPSHQASIVAAWPKEDQEAFGLLLKAADWYFDARVDNEVDLSGTARATFQLEERALLERGFLAAIDDLEKGALPRSPLGELARADARLNELYSKIQSKEDFAFGTVTRNGIRFTQREWVKYRDAWVVFGRKRRPEITAESWRVWLTEARVKMLAVFAGE